MQGFGPVRPEAHEPVFHAPWEGRVFALMRALLYTRAFGIDTFRHTQERLPAATYLSVSYYHRWALALTAAARAHGLATADELSAGRAETPAPPLARTLGPDQVGAVLARAPFGREPVAAPRFRPGDRVCTRNDHPDGHTRLPRYARGRVGQVEAVRGCHVFPDAVVAGHGEEPRWLYTVAFDGRELWGEAAAPGLVVSVDAFEPYLDHV